MNQTQNHSTPEPWMAAAHDLCAAFPGRCGLVIRPLAAPELTFTYQPDRSFLAASLIKLPMLLTFGLAAQAGQLDPSQRLELRAAEVVPGCGVLRDMQPGLQPTLIDLVTLMIVLSDNTATNMVMDVLGIATVSEVLARFDLHDTHLRRKMFDYVARDEGIENITTAGDMARLLEIFWSDPALHPATRAQALAILKRQFYESKLPAWTAEPRRWAHKTGELDDADHDVGFLLPEDEETAVIVALLSSDASGKRERVRLANEIGQLVYEVFA
jgi:beta-lactamase class A